MLLVKKYPFLVLMIVAFVSHQGLFAYLFQGTPLVAWKQAIGMIFMLFILVWALRDIYSVKIGISSFYSLLLVLIFAYYYLYLFSHTEFIVGYLLKLIGCAYYLYILIVFSRFNQVEFAISIKGLFTIGSIIIIGVILDSQTQLFQFANATQQGLDIDLEEYRSSYLLGSSTLLFSVLSLPILLNDVFMKMYGRKLISSTIYFLYVFMSVIAIFLSGSRSSLIYMLVFVIIALGFRLRILGYILAIIVLIAFVIYALLIGQDTPMVMRLSSSLSADDPGNVGRIAYWYWFLGDGLSSIGDKYLLGQGLGYLESSENIFATKHFESSFITHYVEIGIVGVVLLYSIIFLIPMWISSNALNMIWLLLMILSTISSPSLFAYIFMISLGAGVGSFIAMHNLMNERISQPARHLKN